MMPDYSKIIRSDSVISELVYCGVFFFFILRKCYSLLLKCLLTLFIVLGKETGSGLSEVR